MDVLKKYQKVFYYLSFLFFALAGVASTGRFLFLLFALIGLILTPFKLKPFKDISKTDYIVTAVLLFLYSTALYEAFDPFALLSILASSYFILQSVAALGTYLSSLESKNEFMTSKSSKITVPEVVIIAVCSVLAMTFFTTSSPLYKVNTWDDVNCYFTVGRALKHGLVPYKDIFDHKGPYTHFLFWIASLISENSYLGVYIFEMVGCFIFALMAWKTVHLFYTPKKYSLVLIPFLIFATYSINPFYFGGCVEELCFPVLSVVVYLALKAEKENRLPNRLETIIIGAITCYLFFAKYTLCGLLLGYLIYVIYRMIVTKDVKNLPIKIGEFLIGFVILLLPIVIYFGINHALADMLEIYFYDNLFLYSGKTVSFSIFHNIGYTMTISNYLLQGLILSIVMASKLKKNYKVMYFLMLISASMFIYLPKTIYYYYCYILAALTIPCFILLSVLLDSFCKRLSKIKIHPEVIACILVLVAGGYLFGTHPNLGFMKMTEEDVPQHAFAEIINETPDAKVFSYDCFDKGFYTYSRIIPGTKYFCMNNLIKLMPEALDERNQEVLDSKFDYIICESEHNFENYELVCERTFHGEDYTTSTFRGINDTYYLYKRIEK